MSQQSFKNREYRQILRESVGNGKHLTWHKGLNLKEVESLGAPSVADLSHRHEY